MMSTVICFAEHRVVSTTMVNISKDMSVGAHGYGAAFDVVVGKEPVCYGARAPGRWCGKKALEGWGETARTNPDPGSAPSVEDVRWPTITARNACGRSA